MKSPNVKSTSKDCVLLPRARNNRIFIAAIATALICPALFTACKTTESEMGSHSQRTNPYAQNDPKTPEEEAYYRDVYSGNWGEESFGGAPTIGKMGGSTTLPEHWRAMPPGAKTLDEIRHEAAQRHAFEARNNPRPLPPPTATAPLSAPTAGSYAAPVQYPAPNPPAQVSTQNPYVAQTAPAATYAPQQAPTVYPQPTAAPSPYATNVAPNAAAPNVAQQPVLPAQQPTQYVAQVPSEPVAQPQPQVQLQPQAPADQSQLTPPTQTPSLETPAAQPSPQPAAQPSYPSPSFSASVELLNASEWILRGQEPVEDDNDPFADPFADDTEGESEDDSDLFGDDSADENAADDAADNSADEAADDEAKDDEAADDEESAEPKDDEAKDNQKEGVPTPVVEVKSENVTEKSVAPDASAQRAAAANDASRSKRPIKIDPSIASQYADIKRPTPNPSAPSDASNVRDRANLDEYVLSGGDSKGEFFSKKDWSVENLDPEDTAAHFDTIDGRILSEPTNKVFIYSPRFGAIRQISGAIESERTTAIAIASVKDDAATHEIAQGVDVREQETKALGATGTQAAEGAESSLGVSVHTGREGVMEGQTQLRLGAMLASETVDDLSSRDATALLNGAIAAEGWSGEQGVAVAADLVNAFSNAYVEGAATIYHIKDDTKTSKLRVIKIANKDSARPGEFVEFAIRFENIGDEPIGNVTILDNLSARLRYVEGTAESSMKADFIADLSETGSLILRWEIEKPLQPKEFGVVRFICKAL